MNHAAAARYRITGRIMSTNTSKSGPMISSSASEGVAAGKTISTEAALKYVLELKTTYDGPNREEYVCEIDRFADDFRRKHGPQVPVAESHWTFTDLEARFGRVE